MNGTSAVIRRMLAEDAPGVFLLQNALAFQDWGEQQIAQEAGFHYAVALVACVQGEIAGYAVFHVAADEAELLSIAVSKNYQRRGIARLLYGEGVRECARRGARSAYLEVRAGNAPAAALYRSLGFVQTYTRKAYYADGEDAVMMKSEKEITL